LNVEEELDDDNFVDGRRSKKRKKKVVRDRDSAWEFIQSWDDDLFHHQFRIERQEFFDLCSKCKNCYPGKYEKGLDNYNFSLIKGKNSTPLSGPITMEIKLAITLRLLAGASHLDMIWYGVQLVTVNAIFLTTIELINKSMPDNIIFNFDPVNCPNFLSELNLIEHQWASVMERKTSHYDLFRSKN